MAYSVRETRDEMNGAGSSTGKGQPTTQPTATTTATTTQPMVRVISKGIPYYTDTAGHAYAYGIDQTGPRLHIGEYSAATEQVTLNIGWEEHFNGRLGAFRTSQAAARLRSEPTNQTKRTKRSGVAKKKDTA